MTVTVSVGSDRQYDSNCHCRQCAVTTALLPNAQRPQLARLAVHSGFQVSVRATNKVSFVQEVMNRLVNS